MKNKRGLIQHGKYFQQITVLCCILVGVLLLAACGGEATPSGPPPTSALAATPLSTHVFGQPTTIIKQADGPETKENNTPAAAANTDVARGEKTYTSKKCGDCHGPQGEGVADKAEKLAGTSLTETEFTDILRTGGQGKLGNEHLYGVQAISPSGMTALYAYVQSLK